MKSLVKVLVSILVFCVLISLVSCGQKSQTSNKVVLKCGGIQAVDDISTEAMQKLADIAKEKSSGSIEIQVFPASQLGAAINQVEAVSMGSQDMFIDSGSWVATFVPDKQVETLFFTFRDEDHYRKYLSSDIMQEFEDTFREEKGIRVLANNWVRIPRSVAATKPIRTLDDFTGLKVRVPDIKGYLESVAALGAKPTQIAWGETYLALKQGVVDACEAPMDNMYTMKFYEPSKLISVTEHQRDNIVVMINEKRYNSLSQDQQEILLAASNEAGDWYSESVKESLNDYLNKMKADGTQFIESDVTAMRERVAQKAEELEKSGLWAEGLYARIQAIK
jgi:tripartite ATP-independent transporter DctP family solute receptor